MAVKPSIPKGTRDFLPLEVARRNYIFETIKKAFKKYGFAPIETPSFELSSTLLGKYGEEGDRLIFKILNSGEKVKKADLQALKEENLAKFSNSLSEKALRYDLTVPFARFVVQHQNELSFPFKRYQIQPVWRADRPQHGRYQEFYQCDADVVGSESLNYELEFILLFDEILSDLQIPDFTVKINNRKILSGIAEICNASNQIIDITVAIDKFDKIGKDGVIKELTEKGLTSEAIEIIQPLFDFDSDNIGNLAKLKSLLKSSEIGLTGINEVEEVLSKVELIGLKNAKLEFDVSLARGLNYYTGAIFEVKANGVNMGSICGGGRYDELTEVFGLKGVPGIGISFGADRIYDVLKELNLFPEKIEKGISILLLNLGKEEEKKCLSYLFELRKNNIAADLYPSNVKMQKQMKYANDISVEYVGIIGEAELQNNTIALKNMVSGQQTNVDFESLLEILK